MNETTGTAADLRRVFSGGGGGNLRHSLALNVGAPFVTYWFMTRHGVPGGDALLVSAAFPLGGVAAAAFRTRRLDLVGVLSLATLALGLLGAFVFHDPRFVLLKESAVTGLIGATCLVSLLAPRPLLFALGRQFSTDGGREALARYDARWADPGVRARSRRMTLVWGVGLLAEAAVRGWLAFHIAPGAMLLVSPALAAVAIGGLLAWTMRYRAGAPAASREPVAA